MISLAAYHSGFATLPGMCEHLLVVTRLAADLGLNTAEPTTLVVDLNCAFASIEQQHDPKLRGRPLAIAAYATDAATIVSSSREARDLGIKTGMRIYEAKAIFPRILVMEPNPPHQPGFGFRQVEADRPVGGRGTHRQSPASGRHQHPSRVPLRDAGSSPIGGHARRFRQHLASAAARLRGRHVRGRGSQELQPLTRARSRHELAG